MDRQSLKDLPVMQLFETGVDTSFKVSELDFLKETGSESHSWGAALWKLPPPPPGRMCPRTQ